ncbi:Beta-lactamase hydrolase-like protein [Acinetobacter calcoaceticus]|jgi:sulfide:quinone oxidoreductase|nr:Beta-lactamase hydrolase-like protein [Acinetobacter calcoaceticus]
MELKQINQDFYIAGQITADEVAKIANQGVKTLICNRLDGEGADQPNVIEIEEAAQRLGIQVIYQPVTSGKITDQQVTEFKQFYQNAQKPVLAYCRSGMRAISLWALAEVDPKDAALLVESGHKLGFNLKGLVPRILKRDHESAAIPCYSVVIVGAGAAGISVASSLLSREPNLDIVIVDPADTHYYQPGWTMVGAGIFKPQVTARSMASVIPSKVKWMKAAVAGFDPDHNQVILEGCQPIQYKALVVCPGLKLNWHGIEGLVETLGKNGVTSNYRYDLAPYTWELVQQLNHGKAIFTQPPMPIKCAGAPQKAMYLSADYWLKQGRLKDISIHFYNTGAVLFGVKEYVPALMQYVEKYGSELHFNHQLVKVDGPAKKAWFKVVNDENAALIETNFDMLHVVPPQQAPDFIRASTLTDEAGWVSVNPQTLQHTQHANIFALGDVMNAPNAKTAAAARAQAPIVAVNVLAQLKGEQNFCEYNGYGSCPLTVERGKIVLAEFGYGGKLLPSFPKWVIDGQRPSRLAWLLKEQILPPIYWQGMLKGREWMVKPERG